MNPTVFVVIPVFNRLEFTLSCLSCLKDQTYFPIRLIVVDGGSSDGTVETLRRDQRDVVLLAGAGELWWTGAMQLGIEYALAESKNADDMLLMMNNDTEVERQYIETLVRVSQNRHAAVGALIVDSRDPSRILDAGEFIDWANYTFPVKSEIGEAETFFDGVDVLPGRGTLVPLYMIRAVGNVNASAFPHYIADYEFFSRLRRHGFRLGITYEAKIKAHVEQTGLFIGHSLLSLTQATKMLFAVNSMHNMRDHWRFIHRCAPAGLRRRLKLRLLCRSGGILIFQTWLKYLVSPLLVWGRLLNRGWCRLKSKSMTIRLRVHLN